MQFMTLVFLLLFCHMLADYPLQGAFLSEAKNPRTDIGKLFWPHALGAHAMIHAGFVFLATGSLLLALAEAVIHAATDLAKCYGWISLNEDQAIHIGCKMLYAAIVVWGAL